MSQETVLTAFYSKEVDNLVNVTINGLVQFQSNAGELVTLTVTKPGGTKDVWTTVTLADKTYTITKPYVAGAYSVVAHVDADAEYQAADSPPFAFNVSLLARTITVTVSM